MKLIKDIFMIIVMSPFVMVVLIFAVIMDIELYLSHRGKNAHIF